MKHKMNARHVKPIRQTARRLPQDEREDFKKVVQQMEQERVIASPKILP